MEWTRLLPITQGDYLTPETAAKVKDINARITAVLASREALEGDNREFAEVAADLGGKALKKRQDLKARELDLLRDEISIREDLVALTPVILGELAAAVTAAYADFEKAQADVRKRLLKMGYVDMVTGTGGPGRIQPGYINNHPEVIAARNRHTTLSNQTNSYDRERENAAALEVARRAMAQACQ